MSIRIRLRRLRLARSACWWLAVVLVSGCSDTPEQRAPHVVLSTTQPRPAQEEGTELRWTARDAVGCVASGDWAGPKPARGTERVQVPGDGAAFRLLCQGQGGASEAVLRVRPGSEDIAQVLPLRIDPVTHKLADARGRPFFLQGEAAWSLIAQLTDEEVDAYLADRRRRGFNALLVNLIEHKFADHAPADPYGESPFDSPGDFRAPADAYFERANRVVQRAEEQGFVVILVPAYLGFDGGSEGWYGELLRQSPETLRSYGRYVAQQFASRRNIIWAHGGDYNPPERRVVRDIAQGIHETLPSSLATAHCAPEMSALDCWGTESWLRINAVYSYRNVRRATEAQAALSADMPLILLESHYENTPGIPNREIRAQAYYALLAGASGQVFGNHPIWHFGGPGYHQVDTTWQAAMDARGSIDMGHLWSLMSAVDWWKLTPDRSRTLLKNVLPLRGARAIAAYASDRTFAMLYVPSAFSVWLDLDALSGAGVSAQWFDPTDGGFRSAVPGRVAGGLHRFAHPGSNAAGDEDWLLVLKSVTSRP